MKNRWKFKDVTSEKVKKGAASQLECGEMRSDGHAAKTCLSSAPILVEPASSKSRKQYMLKYCNSLSIQKKNFIRLKDRSRKRAAVEKVTKQNRETAGNVTKRATVQEGIKDHNGRCIETPESSPILPQTPEQYANFVSSLIDSATPKRAKALKKKSLIPGQRQGKCHPCWG